MYKTWVLGHGESRWATNGMEYPSIEVAEGAALGLYCRWTGARAITVLPVADHPHYLDCETVERLRVTDVIGSV